MSHDGSRFIAEEVTRHETGPTVVMNCAAYSDSKHSFLVAGQESHCQLYHVDSVLVRDEEIENVGHEHNGELKQRRKSVAKTDSNRNSKKLKFVIKPSDSVQTDFQGDEPLLRISRIHPTGKIMATGNRLCQFMGFFINFAFRGY